MIRRRRRIIGPALPDERLRRRSPADQKGVGDQLERRSVHGAPAGVKQFGKMLIDALIFGHRRLDGQRPAYKKLRAAVREPQGRPIGGCDVDIPALIALLVNPDYPASQSQVTEVQTAANTVGQKIIVLDANNEKRIEASFAELVERRANALLIGSDPFFTARREKLVALAAQHRLPTIYQWREFAAIGGLMSYGTDLSDSYRLLGGYAGQILKGAKTANLPVQQSTKVDLVLNLKTAKTLGLTFPISLLGRADEVIE